MTFFPVLNFFVAGSAAIISTVPTRSVLLLAASEASILSIIEKIPVKSEPPEASAVYNNERVTSFPKSCEAPNVPPAPKTLSPSKFCAPAEKSMDAP